MCVLELDVLDDSDAGCVVSSSNGPSSALTTKGHRLAGRSQEERGDSGGSTRGERRQSCDDGDSEKAASHAKLDFPPSKEDGLQSGKQGDTEEPVQHANGDPPQSKEEGATPTPPGVQGTVQEPNYGRKGLPPKLALERIRRRQQKEQQTTEGKLQKEDQSDAATPKGQRYPVS